MKFLVSLLSVIFTGLMLGAVAESFEICSTQAVAVGYTSTLTAVGVMNWANGYNMGATLNLLQTEVWIRDIMENLFNGHEFMNHSIDHSGEVNNRVVHIPQAGDEPTVVVNRSVFPAPIIERTDTDLTYVIDNYTTDPIRVRDFDEVQVSYQKRQNVLSEHVMKLGERIGDTVLNKWSPTADANLVLRTTGANTGQLPHITATGSRLKMTRNDLARMAQKLDKDRVPKAGRYLLLPSEMYYDLLGVDELVRSEFMNKKALPDGVLDRIHGFNIMTRDVTMMFDESDAGVLKAVGAAAAATDCLGAIGWSMTKVARAKGAVKVRLNEDVAEHFGDILSAEVNFGASKMRADSRGIVAIAQGYEA